MTRDINEKSWGYLTARAHGALKAEEYIIERISEWRDWYDTQAKRAKRRHQVSRLAIVIGSALVPVLVNLDFAGKSYVTTAVSFLIVISVSLEGVFRFGERWRSFRATEQLLAREYYYYTAGAGPYTDLTAGAAIQTLVSRVESTIEAENKTLLIAMTKQTNVGSHDTKDAQTPNSPLQSTGSAGD